MATKYEFEEIFQSKVAACVLRNVQFNKRTAGLIKPEYFEKISEAAIVSACCRYFDKYAQTPSIPILVQLLKDDVAAKIIRSDLFGDVKESLKILATEDITDSDYICDQVAQFARHKAMESAGMDYADLIDRKDYDRAAKVIATASSVGANDGEREYDFFSDDAIENRERKRNERVIGVATKDAISTGVRGLDKSLYHKGWGKGEFYVMMGPPKIGKSISLAYFAKNASLAGHNVLFATLEVSTDITAERIDSSITGIAMAELENHIVDAKAKLKAVQAKAGKLKIKEFPTGTLTPNALSRVIQKYKGDGVVFDMIVVDYADIMAPNVRTDNSIENSKSIYVDLRAMAQVEHVVMLSAMQTNREGAKATTSRMEHAAEDFNKIRIPDLVISINRTDEERSRNEARLFFAASRNQKGDFTIHISQDIEAMNFIKSIIKIE